MKEVFHWTEHLFWEIGWAFLSLLRGNVSEAVEMLYCIKVHLLYPGRSVSQKQPFFVIFKQKCTAIIGLLTIVCLCFLISLLVRKFFTL